MVAAELWRIDMLQFMRLLHAGLWVSKVSVVC